MEVPLILPDSTVVNAIFLDFMENFRRLEAWSIRKRTQLLQSRMAESSKAIFQRLRKEAAPQVDSLVCKRVYAVLDSEQASGHVFVDKPLDLRGHSMWHLDGQPVHVETIEDQVCCVQGLEEVDVDAELVQTQTLSSVQDVQQEFTDLWAPRWQKHAGLDEGAWTRILQFALAFLPQLDLQLPPITPEMWFRQIRRLKPKAATGPDGWSRLDLLHMSRSRVVRLLDFLSNVEMGRCNWPRQMLAGFVISLLKPNGRQDGQAFRLLGWTPTPWASFHRGKHRPCGSAYKVRLSSVCRAIARCQVLAQMWSRLSIICPGSPS